jgi:hypothetical protein
MSKFQFIDLQTQVWREGDPPLVNGGSPAAPEPSPIPEPDSPSVRPLLWIGVLGCIVAGAWLCGAAWRWQVPGTPICAALWVVLCLLAVVRAWRTQ